MCVGVATFGLSRVIFSVVERRTLLLLFTSSEFYLGAR